jgi:hypothetical protein
MDLSGGLVLSINSPGGDGLAAERIISICRSYSGTGEFWAVVPGKAKSAATMVCFGASRVIMGPTSELGPVDPQLILRGPTMSRFSAYNVVKSYEDLFNRAARAKGNLEPYLQQLQRYDAREIQELRSALDLAEDISVRALATGMLSGSTPAQIKKKIGTFLTPEITKTHGRPIYRDEASTCGLNVEKVDAADPVWEKVHELYVRTNDYVNRDASKVVESEDHAYEAAPPE